MDVDFIINQLKKGELFIHPTDTIWGVGYHPLSEVGHQNFIKFKGRPSDKPEIGLISDFHFIENFWEPLPIGWYEKVTKIWPAPVTFIWRAQPNIKRLSEVPQLLGGKEASTAVYTLVNEERSDAANNANEALQTASKLLNTSKDGYLALRYPRFPKDLSIVPKIITKLGYPLPSSSINRSGENPIFLASRPSTVVKIMDDSSYEIIRQGSYEIRF